MAPLHNPSASSAVVELESCSSVPFEELESRIIDLSGHLFKPLAFRDQTMGTPSDLGYVDGSFAWQC